MFLFEKQTKTVKQRKNGSIVTQVATIILGALFLPPPHSSYHADGCQLIQKKTVSRTTK